MADSTQNGPMQGGAGGGAVVSSAGPGRAGPAVRGGWGHGAGPAVLGVPAAPVPGGRCRSGEGGEEECKEAGRAGGESGQKNKKEKKRRKKRRSWLKSNTK